MIPIPGFVIHVDQVERWLMAPARRRVGFHRETPSDYVRERAARWVAGRPDVSVVHTVVMRLLTSTEYKPGAVMVACTELRKDPGLTAEMLGEHVAFGQACGWSYPPGWLADPRVDPGVARSVLLAPACDDESRRRARAALHHVRLDEVMSTGEWRGLFRAATDVEVVAAAARRLQPGVLVAEDFTGLLAMSTRDRYLLLGLIVRCQLAEELPPEMWLALLDGTGAEASVLGDPRVPGHLVDALAYDSRDFVRAAVVAHPNASEEARVAAALLGLPEPEPESDARRKTSRMRSPFIPVRRMRVWP